MFFSRLLLGSDEVQLNLVIISWMSFWFRANSLQILCLFLEVCPFSGGVELGLVITMDAGER